MNTLEKLMLAAFIITAVQFIWINVVPQRSRTNRNL